MKKTVWTFGLISGGILSAMMLLTMPLVDTIGPNKGEIIGYTTMVLAGLLIYFGVRSYRDNVAGGTIGFGRAMAVGSLIVAVSSACYVVTWEVIYFRLAPDFVTRFQQAAVDKVKTSGASEAEIAEKLANMKKFAALYQNPVINAAITFLEPLPVGIVLALVSAGILSRKRREQNAGLAAAAG